MEDGLNPFSPDWNGGFGVAGWLVGNVDQYGHCNVWDSDVSGDILVYEAPEWGTGLEIDPEKYRR